MNQLVSKEELIAQHAIALIRDHSIALSYGGIAKLLEGTLKQLIVVNPQLIQGASLLKVSTIIYDMHIKLFYNNAIKDKIE